MQLSASHETSLAFHRLGVDGIKRRLLLVDLVVTQQSRQFGIHGQHVRAAAKDRVVDLVFYYGYD